MRRSPTHSAQYYAAASSNAEAAAPLSLIGPLPHSPDSQSTPPTVCAALLLLLLLLALLLLLLLGGRRQ